MQLTENKKMISKICIWKRLGLVMDTYEDYATIFYHWLVSTNCEKCNCEYTEKNFKCMDHEHLNGKYGPYRNILCNRCNVNDMTTNTSGTPNISYHIRKKKWDYKIQINGKKHRKTFNTKEDAIKYKIEYEKENIYINYMSFSDWFDYIIQRYDE